MKWLICIGVAILVATVAAQNIEEAEMFEILSSYSIEASRYCNSNSLARWDSQTDIGNPEKEAAAATENLAYAAYRQAQYETYFKDADVDFYQDESIKRMLRDLKYLGTAALPTEEYSQLNQATTRMSNIYNLAKVCPYMQPDCDLDTVGLTLDPHLDNLLRDTSDYDELAYYWAEWREKSGKLMRADYQVYVDLMNRAANLNDYNDAGELWRSRYDDPNFVANIDALWDKVEPLYDALHKYVRYQLIKQYGSRINASDPLLPAHLFGNMWAQNWASLYETTKPFPEGSLVDVTQKMVELGWDAYRMFEESDDFYMSMGLPTSNMSFSERAMITKPEDRNVACHASAWDFCDGEDFRVKMCTKVDMDDFITVHHEMGHIMYYLLYAEKHLPFRTGATPAFHEAVGDTIALSVSTPQHLLKINLLDSYADSPADNINALYLMALERVAFLPFGMLIDKWRWDVFSGAVQQSEWNSHWWQYRERYQKLKPPVSRSEEFFDPGAKYHVPANSQYIAYFGAHILQFEFYRSLCIEAGEYDPANPSAQPLHKCDFFDSQPAGDKLRRGLELGASEHWTVALEALTGDTEITGNAIIEYFQPLYEFLIVENEKLEEEYIAQVLQTYNVEAANQCNMLVKAEWDVATDTLSQEKQSILAQAIVTNARFVKENYETHFKDLTPDMFNDHSVQRQVMMLSKLGTDILDDADLMEYSRVIAEMSRDYNDAKVCPFENQECDVTTDPNAMTLDPEISVVLATSTNYDELEYVWKEWHETSARGMRTNYRSYIDVLNKAAEANGYADNGEMWRASYEDENLIANIESMWLEVEDLYNQLHTYVNGKLKEIYGDKMDQNSDLIPAHLLGNMWAQSWTNLYDRVKPFDNGTLIDVTQKMAERNITPLTMFVMSDEFIQGLGMLPNAMSYDESKGAVITKPEDRLITCHASAWDFCDGEDFRIKMCTSVNTEDFITVHHEMGHIQYYLQYAHQDYTFRHGANPGFHEAVGDLFALSVSTPKHFEKIGFLTDYVDNYETNINSLFSMALQRVAFLPFGYLIDKWRWDIFSGTVPETEWNAHWWRLREQYQKVSAPVDRSEIDFDPGAKFHIPADYQYIAYFIAHILEFQLHRSLCLEAGQYEPGNPLLPLHNCDISDSVVAGAKLAAGLELGNSRHWSEALELMTGETTISGSALVEYFKPLYDFLLAENGVAPTDSTDLPIETTTAPPATTTPAPPVTTTVPAATTTALDDEDDDGSAVAIVVKTWLVMAMAFLSLNRFAF